MCRTLFSAKEIAASQILQVEKGWRDVPFKVFRQKIDQEISEKFNFTCKATRYNLESTISYHEKQTRKITVGNGNLIFYYISTVAYHQKNYVHACIYIRVHH
jgi:hypothetical protein